MKRSLKERPGFYHMNPDYSANPLKAYRNIKCPCQSGLKAKRCCGQFDALPHHVAENLKRYLRVMEGD